MFVKREMMDYIGKNSKVTAGVTDGSDGWWYFIDKIKIGI